MLCRRKCCRSIQQGEINIEELRKKVAQGAILVDVRSIQEYNEGHLSGAINIPDFEILKRVNREIPKLNQSVVLYCEYGGRSRKVKKVMEDMGYTNVFHLYGGLEML